jgi:hypothetical protein
MRRTGQPPELDEACPDDPNPPRATVVVGAEGADDV